MYFFEVKLAWLEEPPQVVTAKIGERLIVPCSARGNPSPTIEWVKLGANNEFQGSKLQFYSIQQSDSGQYKCIASNKLDADLTKQISIEVLGK